MVAPHIDEEAIFQVARQIEAAELRAAYLNQVCGDDAALLSRVKALLAVHAQDRAYLASPKRLARHSPKRRFTPISPKWSARRSI